MNGYVAYLAVQQQTAEFAHEARPDARVQPAGDMNRVRRGTQLRYQLSLGLRRLADRVEPRTVRDSLAVPGSR